FVTVLQIDTAVAAVLSASERFEREQEFEVRREISEALSAFATDREQMTLVHVPVNPRVGGGAVKQHDRARRRLGAQRRTLAFGFLHRIGAAVFNRDCDLPVGEFSSVVIFAAEDDLVAFAFTG